MALTAVLRTLLPPTTAINADGPSVGRTEVRIGETLRATWACSGGRSRRGSDQTYVGKSYGDARDDISQGCDGSWDFRGFPEDISMPGEPKYRCLGSRDLRG